MPDTKDSLELEKLRLEISRLQSRWWQQPTFLGIFIPAIVGLVTLWLSFPKELLDVRWERLELQRDLLERDIREYTLQKDSLFATNTRLEWDLDSLQKKISESEQVLVKYENDREQLQGAIRELRTETTALKDSLSLKVFRTALERFYEEADFGAWDLRQVLDRDSTQRSEYLSILNKVLESGDLSHLQRGHLFSLLYGVTADSAYREQLFSVARVVLQGEIGWRDSYSQAIDIIHLFNRGTRWSEEDRIAAFRVLLSIAANQATDRRIKSYLVEAMADLDRLWKFSILSADNRAFLDAVDLARDLVFEDFSEGGYDLHALESLSRLAPVASVVVSSQIFVNEDIDSYGKYGKSELVVQLVRMSTDYPQLNIPDGSSATVWNSWRIIHKDLLDLWMEPGLKKLGDDSLLLSRAMEGNAQDPRSE